MSERITIVVPNGTQKRLEEEAKKQKRSRSNLSMKYILDGLNKEGSLTAIVKGEDLERALRGSDK